MRIILLHNPSAGSGRPSARALKKLFERCGHEVVYASTKSPDWEARLCESADAVAIAGGDGAVSLVALRVAQRGLPFCVLPLGTANNIAISLAENRPIEEIVPGLEAAEERRVDMGTIGSRRGSQPFVESVGAGMLAELIRKKVAKSTNQHVTTKRRAARKRLLKLAERYFGVACDLQLDSEKRSGRYLLIEILNTRLVGPNLPLAPGAQVDDGQFDVICIEVAQRRLWQTYLEQLCAGKDAVVPVPARRCRRVVLQCAKPELHVDDEVFDFSVGTIEVDRAALRFLGPRTT